MLRMRELVLAGAVALGLAAPAMAAETLKPPAQSWSFEGLFGTYDRGALQRGYQVYKEVCAACHAMSQIRFRDLGGGSGAAHSPLVGLGYTDDEVKAIAAEYKLKKPGVVVLTEANWPRDFRATVNGRATPVIRVNHAFLGLVLDGPGEYRVTFRHWPRDLSRNLSLCLLGALLLAGTVWLGRRGPTTSPR
jgi:hypothetical protein